MTVRPFTEESRAVGGDSPSGHADEELPRAVVEAFVAGSIDAVDRIYERYSRPVWSVIVSVLGRSADAEDAMQETIVRAWRASDTFDPGRDLAPWLFTIARRTAIDVLRREQRPTRGDHDAEVDVAHSPPDFVSAWCVWEVRSAIDRLPDGERVVVELSHLHGLTHDRIADHLGVPIGTVKSRSHRAHARLATALAHLRDIDG